MKCCGMERTTPFCPECGTKLEHSPLHELHQYGVRQVNTIGGQLAGFQKKLAQYPRSEQIPRKIDFLRARLEKWRRWLGALRAHLGLPEPPAWIEHHQATEAEGDEE